MACSNWGCAARGVDILHPKQQCTADLTGNSCVLQCGERVAEMKQTVGAGCKTQAHYLSIVPRAVSVTSVLAACGVLVSIAVPKGLLAIASVVHLR
jgi:hypothetical protein